MVLIGIVRISSVLILNIKMKVGLLDLQLYIIKINTLCFILMQSDMMHFKWDMHSPKMGLIGLEMMKNLEHLFQSLKIKKQTNINIVPRSSNAVMSGCRRLDKVGFPK